MSGEHLCIKMLLMTCWTCCRTAMVNFIHLLMVIYPKWRPELDILGRFIANCRFWRTWWNLHLVYGTYFFRKDWDCCFVPRMLWRQWFCANPEGAIQIRYYEEGIACTCWCLWHGWGEGMYMLMFIFAWFSWNGCIVRKMSTEDPASSMRCCCIADIDAREEPYIQRIVAWYCNQIS